jgi:hypothetical protein
MARTLIWVVILKDLEDEGGTILQNVRNQQPCYSAVLTTQYPQYPQCQQCRNINSHKEDGNGATSYPVQISGSAHTVPLLALPSRDLSCSVESECALAS